MDLKQALAYIDGLQWFGSKPGLERIGELLDKLDRPQDKLRFIHIAGTNGKGSCAAMTASVLKAAGHRVGLYTSPYLYRFQERMQINGKPIPDEDLTALVERVKPPGRGHGGPPHGVRDDDSRGPAVVFAGEVHRGGAGGGPGRTL